MSKKMTITEKILAFHAGLDTIIAGDLITANVDIALANDITGPVAVEEFNKIGVEKVFDTERVVFVPDHFVPNKDIKSAQNAKIIRGFSKKHNLKHYFEVGRVGIEHVLLPDKGIVCPGDVVIGADSHTCTYGAIGAFATGVGSTDLACAMATGETWFRVPESIKVVFEGKLNKWVCGKDLILYLIGKIGVDGALYKALEFTGSTIRNLPIDDRFTMCNMAIEAGAKNGIIEPDAITEKYVKNRCLRPYKFYSSDTGANYSDILEINTEEIEIMVALPHLPENVIPVSQIKDINIDQAVIGSCTNGRLSDLKITAEILKNRKIDDNVRLLIFPGTQEIYLDALKLGYLTTIIEAGGVISPPTCGPCLGGDGRPCRRRKSYFHNKQKLCRKNGTCFIRSLSFQSCCCRRKRSFRQNKFS
jgi:3-isopropylmalate/(R)-2-methylmalate dehydratase large subunit